MYQNKTWEVYKSVDRDEVFIKDSDFDKLLGELAVWEEFKIQDISHVVLELDCIQVYLLDEENNNVPYEIKYFDSQYLYL